MILRYEAAVAIEQALHRSAASVMLLTRALHAGHEFRNRLLAGPRVRPGLTQTAPAGDQAPPSSSWTLPVPPQVGHSTPPTLPVPLQARQTFSPVPGVPGAAW